MRTMGKLLCGALAVMACALGASANAGSMSRYSNGFVVPNVIHNGPSDTTVVTLINMGDRNTAVDWWFSDGSSMLLRGGGCLTLTGSDMEPFVWSSQSPGSAGIRGFLVFAVRSNPCGSGTDMHPDVASARLSGDAHQINVTGNSVGMLPVIDGPVSLFSMAGRGTFLTAVAGADNNAKNFTFRYAVDGAPGGLDTHVVVWSTAELGAQYLGYVFDDKQNRKSVNLNLPAKHQNLMNVESILGLPTSFREGFVSWPPATSSPTFKPGRLFIYSLIESPSGAVQTVLGSSY